jgi:2-haloacid dehalogenase
LPFINHIVFSVASSQLWFAEVLRDAFAAQLSGIFVPFKEIAGYHLAKLSRKAGKSDVNEQEAAAALANAWREAQPYPDAGPGLARLNKAGIKVAALTNGSIEIAGAVLQRAGLASDDLTLFDITQPRAWKPSQDSYTFALSRMNLQPHEVMMVAAHPWDCSAALRLGMKAAYIQRDEEATFPSFLNQPQLVVRSFEELASALLQK